MYIQLIEQITILYNIKIRMSILASKLLFNYNCNEKQYK